MRDTRAVCFVFMCNVYVIESLQINNHEEIEAKAQGDLGVNITISPLRNEEDARIGNVPARVAATPGDGGARVKRQPVEYPMVVLGLGNPADMQTKSMYMLGQVMKGLYSAARRRQLVSASGINPFVKMIKGKVFGLFFPPETTVENVFKWKLETDKQIL